MNNSHIPIKNIRKCLDFIEKTSSQPEIVAIGLTESKMGLEFCFSDKTGKLHTIVLNNDKSFKSIYDYNFLENLKGE